MNWIFQYVKTMGDNFGQVMGRIYRSARPTEDVYKKLLKNEVGLILCLEDGDQEDQEEKQREARARGFRWHQIPMRDDATPRDEDVAAAVGTIARFAKTGIAVHCKGGRHRTGLIIATFRVREQGKSKEDAWKEAEKFGW